MQFQLFTLAKKFIKRLRRGDFLNALYLSYFYSYLYYYDWKHKTNFTHSEAPSQANASAGMTGNFPCHPGILANFIKKSHMETSSSIIDIGCGSGMVLHVLYRCGFRDLSGIEFLESAYTQVSYNLKNKVQLYHGNALEMKWLHWNTILFFSPFRGQLAKKFFEGIPDNVETILSVNHDPIIEPILLNHGFVKQMEYKHPIYLNFNYHLWCRKKLNGSSN